MAAIQGSRWLSEGEWSIADELLEITRTGQLPEDDTIRSLAISAALCPSLTSPTTSGMILWLQGDVPMPGLRKLVAAIQEFANIGWELRPDDVHGRRTREEAESSLTEAEKVASTWLSEEAPSHRTKLRRASSLWHRMVRSGGAIFELLQPVVNGRRQEVASVRKQIERWCQRTEIIKQINALDAQLHGTRNEPIQGSPREQLVNWILDACNFSRAWCQMVERVEGLRSKADWVDEQVERLCRHAKESLPDSISAATDLAKDADLPNIAMGYCLRRALSQLTKLLNVAESESSDQGTGSYLATQVALEPSGVVSGLRRRLWWLPEVTLDDLGDPTEQGLAQIGVALAQSYWGGRTLAGAIETWMENQDFRFTQPMLEAIQENAIRASLADRHRLLLETSRHVLQEECKELVSDIEQALVDGVIADDERSQRCGEVVAIAPEEVVHFGKFREKLTQVREFLSSRHKERLASQLIDWREKQDRLLRAVNPAQRAPITEFVESAIDRKDSRVVGECLSRLEEAMAQGVEPAIEWFTTAQSSRDEFKEYVDRLGLLDRTLDPSFGNVVREIERGRSLGGLEFGSLPKPHLQDATSSLEFWRELKKRQSVSGEQLCPSVRRVLRYIGFSFVSEGTAVSFVKSGYGWAHFHASISSGGLSPVPQFGSSQQSPWGVTCLWEDSGSQTIRARLREAKAWGRNSLIFYLGRLKERIPPQDFECSSALPCLLRQLTHTCLKVRAMFRERCSLAANA